MKNMLYMKIVTLSGLLLLVAFLTGCANSVSQSDVDALQNQLNAKDNEIKKLNEDKQSRQWILEAQDTLIIGEYGHNFAYDGKKVRPVEGKAFVDVNSKTNTGSVIIELKNVRHQLSADEFLNGDVKIIMEEFEGSQPFKQGSIAENLYLHGASGNGPPVMPKLFTFLAGWGKVDIFVNGKKTYEDLDAHIMYTEGARINNKIMKLDGTVYNPKLKAESGFTDSSKREFHIVAHSTDEDKNNFPPNSQWIHLNFQEVALKKAPEDAVLFVPIDDSRPILTLLEFPNDIVSGQSNTYSWKIEGGNIVEHTNIHTSFTSDFEERTDTDKQSGIRGIYSDTLSLETDEDITLYIQAHAKIDGENYNSEVITKTLKAK